MIRNSLTLILLLSLFGCTKHTFYSTDEILEFIKDEDNGYFQTKKIEEIEITLLYKPTDLVMSQELKKDNNYQKSDSLKKLFSTLIYFNLGLSKNNKEILSTVPLSRQDFNVLQDMLTFRMNNKVVLTTNDNDTLQLIDYNCPRTYGMGSKTLMLFIFKKNKKFEESSELNFCLSDIGIGTGDVCFKLQTNIIKNQPRISN